MEHPFTPDIMILYTLGLPLKRYILQLSPTCGCVSLPDPQRQMGYNYIVYLQILMFINIASIPNNCDLPSC